MSKPKREGLEGMAEEREAGWILDSGLGRIERVGLEDGLSHVG